MYVILIEGWWRWLDSGWLRGCRCEVGAWGALCAWTTERLGICGRQGSAVQSGRPAEIRREVQHVRRKRSCQHHQGGYSHPPEPPGATSSIVLLRFIRDCDNLLLLAAAPMLRGVLIYAPRRLSAIDFGCSPLSVLPTLHFPDVAFLDCTPRLFRGRIKGLQCRTLWAPRPPFSKLKGGG